MGWFKPNKKSAPSRRAVKGKQPGILGSLIETAARAAITATVTFLAGWALKRLFQDSVTEVASDAAKPSHKLAPSKDASSPARYKAPARRLPQDTVA